MAPIYAARENNTSGVSSEKISERVNAQGGNATVHDSFESIITTIKKESTANDLILVMGAGDITNVSKQIIV